MGNKNPNISFPLIWGFDPIIHTSPQLYWMYSTVFSLLPTGQIQTPYAQLMRFNFMLFIYSTICSLVGLTVWTDYARLNCHVFSVPVVIYQTIDTHKSSFCRYWVYYLLVLKKKYIEVYEYKIQPRNGVDSNYLYRLVWMNTTALVITVLNFNCWHIAASVSLSTRIYCPTWDNCVVNSVESGIRWRQMAFWEIKLLWVGTCGDIQEITHRIFARFEL